MKEKRSVDIPGQKRTECEMCEEAEGKYLILELEDGNLMRLCERCAHIHLEIVPKH